MKDLNKPELGEKEGWQLLLKIKVEVKLFLIEEHDSCEINTDFFSCFVPCVHHFHFPQWYVNLS